MLTADGARRFADYVASMNDTSPGRPVLVGFDPQTLDSSPVRVALAVARLTGSPLIVAAVSAHAPVVDLQSHGGGEEGLDGVPEHAFAALEGDLGAHGVAIEYREISGVSAARALYEEAEREQARLTVVGSTDRGVLGRVLAGSTAERLLHGSTCPVAVVPHGWRPDSDLETVGVAYTDTDEGLTALRFAHGLSRTAEAQLRVLSVVTERLSLVGEVQPSGRYGHGDTLVDVQGAHRVQLEATVREEVGRLPGLASDVEVSVDIFVGDPAETLIGVTENLDLLVCGARGYGPVRSVLLGGVSRRILAGAHCPVIVLARGMEAPSTASGPAQSSI